MHDRSPKRRSALDRQGFPHRATVRIANPDGYGVLFVESDSPGISKPAASAGLSGYSFAEGQRRISAKALSARIVVAENIRDDFGSGWRGDAPDRKKLGGE